MTVFDSAWVVVKGYRSGHSGLPYEHPEGWTDDDVFCCGITASQAAEQSWNFCPFCGETIPSEIVANYDTIMTGHPNVEGEG
tara:strand:- start:1297 stop:1542 length:246 start_codon:yes stop_codon:yes gene_type:complete